MNDSNPLREKHAQNRHARREQIRAWAAYVRSHPDSEWGEQVNELVDAQLQSARHFEDERPDLDRLQHSPLVDEFAVKPTTRDDEDR